MLWWRCHSQATNTPLYTDGSANPASERAVALIPLSLLGDTAILSQTEITRNKILRVNVCAKLRFIIARNVALQVTNPPTLSAQLSCQKFNYENFKVDNPFCRQQNSWLRCLSDRVRIHRRQLDFLEEGLFTPKLCRGQHVFVASVL